MRTLASRIVPHALPVVLLAGMLIPRSSMEVAAKIGYESHVVSFLIGPASYEFGTGLTPGNDYFSQYSVGLPFLFSLFMGSDADTALVRYVGFIVFAMVAFYVGLYYCLRWLLGSWIWALSTTVTIALLQFHDDRTFFDPSSYVLRYPLLVLAVWMVARWAGTGFPVRLSAGVVLTIGSSIFLNTETGIIIAIVSLLVGFAFNICGDRSSWIIPPVVFCGGWIGFFMLSLFSFGAEALTIEYLRSLFQPFFIYGGGFGGVGIDWRFGEHILYNVVAPGATVATAILCVFKLWNDPPSTGEARSRIAALLGFSAVAVLFSAKYINMSFIALWHVNAIGFLTIGSWWACQSHRHLLRGSDAAIDGSAVVLRGLVVPVVSIGIAAALLFSNDPRNQSLYGARAWASYPSVINPISWRWQSGCRELQCSAPRIAESDVLLVQQWTRPNERVALLSPYDWAYLVGARRASWFRFLPSTSTFTRDQLAAAAQPPHLVFLPKTILPASLGTLHREVGEIWRAALKDYEAAESSEGLTVWKRKIK